MKFVKGISLFVLYPLMMFGLGVYAGIAFDHFFYPGKHGAEETAPHAQAEMLSQEMFPSEGTENQTEFEYMQSRQVVETAKKTDVLTADTEYVLRETDTCSGDSVETVWKVPQQYLGMDRKEFLKAMEDYAQAPPLKELEQGFEGLEVLSFSGQRVVVQMNYNYERPAEKFYLCVEQNEIVVYLEDKETVYMNTGILLETLPESVQMQIMGYLLIEDEEALYNFLESYSS